MHCAANTIVEMCTMEIDITSEAIIRRHSNWCCCRDKAQVTTRDEGPSAWSLIAPVCFLRLRHLVAPGQCESKRRQTVPSQIQGDCRCQRSAPTCRVCTSSAFPFRGHDARKSDPNPILFFFRTTSLQRCRSAELKLSEHHPPWHHPMQRQLVAQTCHNGMQEAPLRFTDPSFQNHALQESCGKNMSRLSGTQRHPSRSSCVQGRLCISFSCMVSWESYSVCVRMALIWRLRPMLKSTTKALDLEFKPYKTEHYDNINCCHVDANL